MLGLLLKVGLGLIVALGAGAGIAYYTDYGLEAVVVSKDCGSTGGSGGGFFPFAAPSVTVKTKIGGLRHTEPLSAPQYCHAIEPGNFVVYHIRSGHTTVYSMEGGRCIYDSTTGLANCPT
ncbi:MAG TPA: hypothetical protein VM286_02855 [Candidatus Thermoplasmatota archaeon]|nr:hypothetical protein [Candidatus Thermoplasmatota archaeon]